MWRTLCPTISTGDEVGDFAAAALEPDALYTAPAVGTLQPDTARNLKSVGMNGLPQLVLNCSTRFTQLFNGFAGAHWGSWGLAAVAVTVKQAP